MAASLPAIIVMTLYFALLFWVFIPGNFFTFPSGDYVKNSSGDQNNDRLVHAAVFGIVLTLSYEVVANFVYKTM